MSASPAPGRRRWGGISPGIWSLVGIAVLALGGWLYWLFHVDRAYGFAVVTDSLGMATLGRRQVEMFLLDQAAFPHDAGQMGFVPKQKDVGPSDRVVRLRLEMLAGGELVIHYDGWKFHDARLRLVPKVVNQELSWTCEPVNVPRAWVQAGCQQLEQERRPLGFEPSPSRAGRAEASTPPVTWPSPEPVASGPPTWDAPFRSGATLAGKAAVVAEGLRQLEPFQRFAQEYANAHHELPSSRDEMEARFPEEQRRVPAGEVKFGPGADMWLEVEGVTLLVSALFEEGGHLVWTCRAASDEPATNDLPPECSRPE